MLEETEYAWALSQAVYEDAVAGAKLGDGDGGTPWPDEADGLSVLEHHADVGLLVPALPGHPGGDE